MEQLDIVKLIEDNPITKLSSDYNIKLLLWCNESIYYFSFKRVLILKSFSLIIGGGLISIDLSSLELELFPNTF